MAAKANRRRRKTTLRATNGMEVRVVVTRVSVWWAGSQLFPRRFWAAKTA